MLTLILEKSDSDPGMLIVSLRGPGACKIAKEQHQTILGERWEGLAHEDPDYAYAKVDDGKILKKIRDEGYTMGIEDRRDEPR